MANYFDTKIEFLKGVGERIAKLLREELQISTFGDLLQHYPFRHEDRSQFHQISEVHENMPYIQLVGKVQRVETVGVGNKKRLVAYFSDGTGVLELVWFQGARWIASNLKMQTDYVVFGKPNRFGSKFSIAHPEMEVYVPGQQEAKPLQPVYATTEKLKRGRVDSKAIAKLQKRLIERAYERIPETLPAYLIEQYGLISKKDAMRHIHFPESIEWLEKARFRLKFEELFYVQLRILKLKLSKMEKSPGQLLGDTQLVHAFYEKHLPFELTEAQKKVIREIFEDLRSGKQMNRLLQGDVGSGKTIVAFICMLIAIGSGAQVAMMAPTEILAEQHFRGLKDFAKQLGLHIALLTGSTKTKERRIIDRMLRDGDLHILVGTHALLEEHVQFNNLGLSIVDEQHRFGVAQRARLWQKNDRFVPHVLVMTATPIPRTLAMTLYGDLDVSVIDELPAGRKPIKTVHRYEKNRLTVFGFIREQVNLGRQIYIVYPLIEESEKLDLKHLEDGYESIRRAFPDLPVSVVHGRMKAADKDFEMQRFAAGKTKIMVATTVIEVGVNVPNASVMIIENAERFGLAQLHQLRGRVGRGAEQSYCILMTEYKLSKESKVRLNTMVRTNDGFEVSEVDLKLRGPGDIEGTQQSGVLDLLVADITKDGKILQEARLSAMLVLEKDPELILTDHQPIRNHIYSLRQDSTNWSKIS
ncbi:ATP-dependent DNA helicase RecG [Catalinimonas alkaloidigena]|uniref:ATP-dependent DNA helicase RecG n=1 Tax=Catalinimonas alkaloidigena TaxID=1075417 RepID=UPI002404A37D|nr:ATP-dependent DNA helicase RecG [Catalinimonas alkaloidigena]MDF9799996.1 ATP-dependent DNA helicase RecG [Catalinimonas alkaloidigena]